MHVRLLGTVFLVASCLTGTLYGQPAPFQTDVGHPFLTYFGPAEYDAAGQNWAIVEDERGVIYVGNNVGLLEYDGVSWRLLQMPNHSVVRSLARDAEGRIWVGANRELGYLEPDSLGNTSFVSLRQSVPEPYRDFADVWHTFATNHGVYFLTIDAIFRWNGSTMQVWPAETAFHVASVVDETFYVREWGKGLMRIERTVAGDSLRPAPGGERFADIRIWVMLRFDEERILIGTREEGLFLYDGTRFEPFETEADELLAEGVLYHPAVALPEGRFALATIARGLLVIDRAGRLIHQIDRDDGLPVDAVYHSYLDGMGNLWMGLEKGIARVDIGLPYRRFDVRTGVANKVTAMARHDGRIYAGLLGGDGLIQLASGTSRFQAVRSPVSQVFALLPVDGEVLIAGSDEGLHRVRGTLVEPVRPSSSGRYVALALHRSRNPNVVFVGLDDGLGVLHRGGSGWEDAGHVPGLEIEVWTIATAPDGTLWLGLDEGVARVHFPDLSASGTEFDPQAAEVRIFGALEGLPEGGLGVNRAGDEVYFTGREGTVFRYDEAAGRFVDETVFDAARSGHPLDQFSMRKDEQGRVWITSPYGAPVVAHPSAAEGGYTFEPLRPLRKERISDVYLDPDSTVWMLGADALIRYDTRHVATPAEAYRPLVRRVWLGEDDVIYGGAGEISRPKLSHGSGAVHFAYAAPGAAGSARYRTQLDGFEAAWSSWTTETGRTYTNLPPGDYLFRVEADGRGENAYAFTVLPPWYRTWWAYGFYAMVLGVMVFFVDRVQRRRLVARERERAREHELEQAREIERAYTELKATQQQLVHSEKMASLGLLTAGIAHEIKNPLNFVNNFAALSRDLTGELREEVEALDGIADAERVAEIQAILTDLELNATKIEEHGKRADGIVRSMMQHSRGGSGQRESVDLNRFVDEYVDLAWHGRRATAPAFNVEIIRDYGEGIGSVEVVAQDLGRVLINLLSNAFDAVSEQTASDSEPHAARVRIATRRSQAEHVEVRVEDNGPGIPDEVVAKIFEPFFTTKPTGSGTGLGLSMSYDIVTRGHGGTLNVETEAGRGATFIVTLPIETSTAEPGD